MQIILRKQVAISDARHVFLDSLHKVDLGGVDKISYCLLVWLETLVHLLYRLCLLIKKFLHRLEIIIKTLLDLR